MLSKLLCLIILLSFSLVPSLELGEAVEGLAKMSKIVELDEDHCEDCHLGNHQEQDCADEHECCMTLCSCPTVSTTFQLVSSNGPTSKIITENHWFKLQIYQSPLLDPALKPPLFS